MKRQSIFRVVNIFTINLALMALIFMTTLTYGGPLDYLEKKRDEARVNVVKSNIKGFKCVLDAFKELVGAYPPNEIGLKALLENPGYRGWSGPYIDEIKKDPWENDYIYKRTETSFTLLSLGKDGKLGTSDDISETFTIEGEKEITKITLEELLKDLKSDNKWVRKDAMDGIIGFRDKRAVKVMIDILSLEGEDYEGLKEDAITALGNVGGEEDLEPIINAFYKEKEEHFKCQIILTIAKIGGSKAKSFLNNVIKNESGTIKKRAEYALKYILKE